MLARKHKVKHNLASKQMPAGKGYNRGDGKTTKEAYDRGGICGAGRQSPRQTVDEKAANGNSPNRGGCPVEGQAGAGEEGARERSEVVWQFHAN